MLNGDHKVDSQRDQSLASASTDQAKPVAENTTAPVRVEDNHATNSTNSSKAVTGDPGCSKTLSVAPANGANVSQHVTAPVGDLVDPSTYSSTAVPVESRRSNSTQQQRPEDPQPGGEEDDSRFSLQNFFSPVLPVTCQTRTEGATVFSDDWHKIDSVDVTDCLLSITPSLQEVPDNHKHQFARAF